MGAAVTAAIIGATATAAAAGVAASNRPKAPKAPGQVDNSANYQQLTQAEINSLPGKVSAELSARNNFDQASQDERLRLMGESAPQVASQAIDVAKTYGPAFIELQKAAAGLIDPNAVALRDQIGSSVLAELSKGRDLTDQQRSTALGDIRGAQVARGNTEGTAAILDEGLNLGAYRDNLFQQRLSNAAGYFGLPKIQDLTAGLQTGYTPLPQDSFRLLNPNTGIPGAQLGAQEYNTQAGMYNSDANIRAQSPNPWVQGLGMIGGAAANYAAYRFANPFTSTTQTPGTPSDRQVQQGKQRLEGYAGPFNVNP